MKTYHVDGGAKIEPPDYQFKDAYFSVLDNDGEEIHVNLSVGDFSNNIAEYEAIKWVVTNIEERPIKIYSDSNTAISWARKGGKSMYGYISPLYLADITLEYLHNNLADQYNATYISPKQSKSFYKNRHYSTGYPYPQSTLGDSKSIQRRTKKKKRSPYQERW